MSTEPKIVEHFFGVYLLYCKNPKYKGRTYIGYTVDPKRRIKQHNAGKDFGGAWKTSNRGPWEMVLIVHGFPNATSALRFEWAWQHPQMSRRLKHVPKKKSRQRTFDYCLEVLTAMLNAGPWSRLPLTVRWLDDEFGNRYSDQVGPPLHMPITYGKVTSRQPKSREKKGLSQRRKGDSQRPTTTKTTTTVLEDERESPCSICSKPVEQVDGVTCIKPGCTLTAHLICLANVFRRRGDGAILPIEGCCPICDSSVLWGDLIRKKIGCNMHLDDEASDSDSSDG